MIAITALIWVSLCQAYSTFGVKHSSALPNKCPGLEPVGVSHIPRALSIGVSRASGDITLLHG